MEYEEKTARRAFSLAKEKGKRIPGNKDYHRGGWKYQTKDFNITAIFADGPDFEGCDLSDCSSLNVSYKGRRVFRYIPWDDNADIYKSGKWEGRLEGLTKELFHTPRPKDWEDEEAEMARLDRDWAEYARTHND